MALTKRQKQVLDFLADFVEKNGYSPSYEEIASALELASLATVHKHVSALETKHYLRRTFNQSRSLEVSSKYLLDYRRQKQESAPRLEVPLLGSIAAGSPVESFASQEKSEFRRFLGHSETYALAGARRIDDRRSHLQRRLRTGGTHQLTCATERL